MEQAVVFSLTKQKLVRQENRPQLVAPALLLFVLHTQLALQHYLPISTRQVVFLFFIFYNATVGSNI